MFLCIAMTGANVYLLHINKSLRAVGAQRITGTPPGKVVTEISGLDFSDRPITINTSTKKATILLIYSPTCPYCEKNWPAWSALINRISDQDIDFVTVDVTSQASSDFLATKHPGRAYAIHRMNPREIVDLNLALTPETVVIGRDSKIQRVWAGPLSADDIASITKLVIS